MSAEDHDLNAAELVLGSLDEKERRQLTAALRHDADLRARVTAWEDRLAALETAPPGEEPPADLWARIEADLDREPQAPEPAYPAITLRAAEGGWLPQMAGVEKKLLLRDPERGEESYLLRIAPGTRLEPHGHRLTEECLMLEGDFTIGSLTLRPGDYHVARAGTEHPASSTRGGALLYIRGEIREAG